MSAYLSDHLPHLLSLHHQLGLPPETAKSDEARIESAIRSAVTSLIRERETEVDGWKDTIGELKRDVGLIARAVGEKGRVVLSINRRESLDLETLPVQCRKLTEQKEELYKEYEERLRKVEELQARVDYLCTLLGPPFEPPKPLKPIAGPSKTTLPPQPDIGRKLSSTGTNGGRKLSNGNGRMVEEITVESWMDVGEEGLEGLEEDYRKALEERTTRINNLQALLLDLLWQHRELALPPIPISQPHHFPLHLLPSRATEEKPGAHAGYEKLLSRFFSANAGLKADEESGEMEGEVEGMEGVEPDVGLVHWAEELLDLWSQERDRRQLRIQELYNQLEPLWARLEVDQDQMDVFIQMNMGCGEPSIRAYEAELERCLELRKSSLSSFVLAARREIETLWQELMLSEDEKGDFGAFIDDEYTEDLLHLHEEEAERLRAEIESKAILLPRVCEWFKLREDEEELERNQNDPNRFKARGGQMLREEKLRKRVGVLKPKIELELLTTLPTWEEANGRPFMVQGERVVDRILDDREAKEMVKEMKKRAKQGLAPAKIVARPTPSIHTAKSTQTGAIRKRDAPTPCPIGGGTISKRPRLVEPTPTIRSTIAKSARPTSNSNSNFSSTRRDQGSSPTPLSQIPRMTSAANSARTVSNQSGISVFSAGSRVGALTYHSGTVKVKSSPVVFTQVQFQPPQAQSHSQLLGMGDLAKAGGKRPRRESFKPRQSIAGELLKARAAGIGVARESWGVQEEDGEEDEIF